MDPTKRMRRWQAHRRRQRQLVCQCEWALSHLCSMRRECVAHSRAEYEYADALIDHTQPLQLRLF